MEWWGILLILLAMCIEPASIIYFLHTQFKKWDKENTTYSEDNDNE